MLKKVLAFLSLVGLLAGFVALAACDKLPPIPIPTPPPTFPTPPPDTPGEPWDCDNEPELVGEVKVDGIEGEYNVWRKDAVGAKFGTQDAYAGTAKIAGDIGARNVRVYAGGRAFAGAFDVKALKKLRADKSVQFFHKKVPVKAYQMTPTKLPGLDRIGQLDLPLNGQIEFVHGGEHSALVTNDTGIYFEHDAFKGRMQKECKTVITFGGCSDRHGHGTHVTGTAAGTTWGIATQSIIYAGRSLDENGSGTDTGVAEILTWTGDLAAGNASKRFVTNLSLGGGYSPTINKAVCYARNKNVLVVVAAGNDYREDSCGSSPAGVKQALTVGAMDPRNDNVADFSNAGGCVDLYAPGVDIESAWNTGGSNTISGTSMATPHVAGFGLLYRTARFDLSPDAVHDAIVELATEGTLNRVPSGTANLMLFIPLRIPAPGKTAQSLRVYSTYTSSNSWYRLY